MRNSHPNTAPKSFSAEEATFDGLVQRLVEKALLNVSEPLIETVVERVITRKITDDADHPMEIEEAALLVKKSKQTLYNYCSQGKIPFHKSGSRNIFFRKELIQWLRSNS